MALSSSVNGVSAGINEEISGTGSCLALPLPWGMIGRSSGMMDLCVVITKCCIIQAHLFPHTRLYCLVLSRSGWRLTNITVVRWNLSLINSVVWCAKHHSSAFSKQHSGQISGLSYFQQMKESWEWLLVFTLMFEGSNIWLQVTKVPFLTKHQSINRREVENGHLSLSDWAKFKHPKW